MAWQTLAPPSNVADKAKRVKIGTRSRNGWLYGQISWGGPLGETAGKGASVCSVAYNEDSRRLQIVFGRGEFKIAKFKKGGGRILLPEADWLPSARLRALPVAIDTINGTQIEIQLPDAWPELPAE